MSLPDESTTTSQTPPNGAPAEGAGAPAGATPAAAPPAGTRPTTDVMSPELLAFRLERERDRGQADLLKAYGVTSKEELDAKLKRIADLEKLEGERAAKDEEAKRASMTEVELVKADLAAARTTIAELRRQLEDAQGESAAVKHGLVVRAAAGDFIDPEFIEAAELQFAAHIRELKKTAPSRIEKYAKASEVREWFRDLAAKKPRMAKGADIAPPPPKPAVQRKPVSTGVRPAAAVAPAPGKPPAPNGGKTARPGQKNSMSSKEAEGKGKELFGPGFKMN